MKPKVDGLEQLQENMRALAKKYGQATAEGLVASGNIVRSEAIKSIQAKSPGNTVTRTTASGNEYEHTASRPGDAPNTDTGALVKSIQVEVTPSGVYVGSNIEYAASLEFGTAQMAARPWLHPALMKSKEVIKKILKGKIKNVKPAK